MFTVYNETKEPINVISLNSNNLFILKKFISSRENKPNKHSCNTFAKSLDVRISKRTIFKNPFELKQTKNRLENLIEMKPTDNPKPIIESDLSIIFNRSEFNPFVIESSTSKNKALGILSISLSETKKLVSYSTSNCFLLSNFKTSTEFTTFISINNNATFYVTVYNTKENVLYTYKFINCDGVIKLNVESKKVDSESKQSILNQINKTKISKMKNYKPAKPTYNIIMRGEMEIPKIISQRKFQPNIISYNSIDDLEVIINDLYLSKVRAVTLYIPRDIPLSEFNKVSELCSEKFNLVYCMYNNDTGNEVNPATIVRIKAV